MLVAWHSAVVAGAGNYTVPWIIKNYASNRQMTLDFKKNTKIVRKIASQSKLVDASAIDLSFFSIRQSKAL